MYDIIVIGGGPAGLSAGLFSKWFGMNTLILNDMQIPSQLALATVMENYPGIDKVSGPDFIKNLTNQAKKIGAEIKEEKVTAIKIEGSTKKVFTNKGEHEAHALIVCTGAKHRQGGLPGEEEFLGRGVSYCASCDGHFFVGKDVIVWGGGDTAMTYAIHLQTIGCKVTLVHRRKEFRASEFNVKKAKDLGVKFILERSLKEVKGDKMVERVILDDGTEVSASAVFVAIGEIPSIEILKSIGINMTKTNFIDVDKYQNTNVPGVFAAGDVTPTLKQVAVAVGHGAVAAKSALDYVQHQTR